MLHTSDVGHWFGMTGWAVGDAGPYAPATDKLFVGGGVPDAPRGERTGYDKRP